jgi:putative peptidoglycan lipid II flippase
MSVAAAELPELARQRVSDPGEMAARVSEGLRQIAVYVVPSTAAFALLGDIVVAALYQTGRFSASDTVYVYIVLIGFTVGLMASTGTRLFSSTFFALHDTITPAKIASIRVVLTGVIGYALMVPLERHLSIAGHPMGVLGLTLGAGLAAWVEWLSLKRVLKRRIGPVGAGAGPLARMIAAALVAALVGRAIAFLVPSIHGVPWPSMVRAVLVLGPFGVVYFLLASAFGVTEATAVLDRVLSRLKR